MTRARIREDLDRIVAAARELLAGSVTYEQSLRDYFPALVAAHGGRRRRDLVDRRRSPRVRLTRSATATPVTVTTPS